MIRPRLLPGQLLGVGGTAGSVHRAQNSYEIVLGPVGRCPHEPTHTIVVFDNSGSVTGGNDVIGNRFTEAELAFEAVARRCRCGREMASCISFDSPTGLDAMGIPLRGGLAKIKHGLAVPRDAAGSSVLGPSLDIAQRLTKQYPTHQTVLVVLSDFELFDPDVAKTLDEFRTFPGDVHAVVLRSTPPQELVDDDRVSVTAVTYDSPPGSVANAVLAGLTMHRRPARQSRQVRAIAVASRSAGRSS